MKIPQTPPFLEADFRQDPQGAMKEADMLMQGGRIRPPDDYLHWDEIRHRPLPEGFPDHLSYWKCLKILRIVARRVLPLADQNGELFSFALPDEAQRGLIEADSGLRGSVDSPEPLSPGLRDRWLVKSLVEEEAIHSSLLEGAPTTRARAKEMLRQKRKPRDAGERMVLNNCRAMEFVRENQNRPLSESLICELHRIITEETLKNPADAGRFRAEDLEDFGVFDASGEMLYRPPLVGELPARMRAVCEFANAPKDARPFVHPVVRAIVLHFQIGHDHPFADGNGRTARALFYWLMLKNGYWLTEHVSISGILRRAPAKYARAYLHSENDDGDLTYFILHQLRTLKRAIDALHEYLNARERQISGARRALKKFGECNPRQLMLLEYALRHARRGYAVREHRDYHGVTTQTARTDLTGLARMGYLEMRVEGKAHVFYPTEKLFSR